MPQPSLDFQVSGTDADTIAAELAEWLAREVRQQPQVARQAPVQSDHTREMTEDARFWITVAVALPAAMRETANIASQVWAADVTQKLVAWARQRMGADDRIDVVANGQFLGKLDEVEEAKVVQFLKQLEQNGESDASPSGSAS